MIPAILLHVAALHLAPNAPWVILLLLALTLIVLGLWAYRFDVPPLPPLVRHGLFLLRALALTALVFLLAQPVLERGVAQAPQVTLLLDQSASMSVAGNPPRAAVARRAAREIEAAWRGRAVVRTLPFAARLGTDSTRIGSRAATAPGDALAALARSSEGQDVQAVVLVSDGAANAGADAVEAARALGVPVHAVIAGDAMPDRAISGVDAPLEAQVGRPVTVRVRVVSGDARGTPLTVVLAGEGRELGRVTVVSQGPGAESSAEFRAIPLAQGLANWTARIETTTNEIARDNDARRIAFPVSRGRLGVAIVSGGLNWDLTFLRRALAADSTFEVATWVRGGSGFGALEGGRAALSPASLRGQAVVVLDGLAPAEVSPAFDDAVLGFVREGGAVLALGGGTPGVARLRSGRFGSALSLSVASPMERTVAPAPAADARELLAWDDDPARGERAWRAAAPLSRVVHVVAGGGDRVLVQGAQDAPPLLFARGVGRGQVLFVNGAGTWRWSLSGHDELSHERGRQLWRRLVRWLAEPVQGEPLRVRPERWVSEASDPVRLVATLQDENFRPQPGAVVTGEISAEGGGTRRIEFTAREAGAYVAEVAGLPAGRHRVAIEAQRGSRSLGRAGTEFAVDRWSLEVARVQPDSAALAAIAAASGGRVTHARDAAAWARRLDPGTLARRRVTSARLWESPWVFALVVGALGIEWAWRRRRGLP